MNVFDLMAGLSLDTSSYDKGLLVSEQKGNSFGSSLTKGLGKSMAVVGAGIAATAGAVTAAGAAMVSATGEAAAYGDQIDKNSQKLGVSAEFYQEWDAVLQHSGTSMQGMTATFKTLASATQNTTDKQAEAFQALGLSLEELSGQSSQEVFTSVIFALQQMEEGTERTAIASTLLGRGAMEMGALLNTSAEDTQAMIDNVNRLGGVMSDEAVKSAAAYQDSLQDLTTSIDGVKRGIVADFLPSMVNVMNGLTAVFSGDMDGMDKISEGIDTIIQKVTDSIPAVLERGADIITNLADAIIGNVAKLAEPVVQVVGKIGDFLLGALPELVNAAAEIVVTLANGIATAAPTLIPTIIDTVLLTAETLLDNVDMILDAGLQIVLGLADGMVTAIPNLISRVPELIRSVLDALARMHPLVIDAGIQLFMTLVDALPEVISALADALPEIITTVVEFYLGNINLILDAGLKMMGALIDAIPQIIVALGGALPQIIMTIADTLMNYDWYGLGKNVLEGIFEGIKNSVPNLIGSIKDTGAEIVDGFKDFFGIHSPSALFRDEVGQFLAQGIGEGFTDEMDSVTDRMANAIPTDFSTDINVNGTRMRSNGSFGSGVSNYITLNINGIQYQNFDDLAAAISEQLQTLTDRREASYA